MQDIFHCDATNEGASYSYHYFILNRQLAKETHSALISSQEVLARLQQIADESSLLTNRPKVTLTNWRFATDEELSYINLNFQRREQRLKNIKEK